MDWISIFQSAKRKVSAKNLLSASGFLLAGALWGIQIANTLSFQKGGNFFSPFAYIMASVYFAILGTLFLAYYGRSPIENPDPAKIIIKNLKEIFYSLIFWFFTFFIANALSQKIFILGKVSKFFTRILLISDATIENIFNIRPLIIADLWPIFWIITILAIVFYAKLFDKRIAWKNIIIFIIIFPLCPAIANLFPNLWIKMILCFALISFLIGITIKISLKENENRLF